MKQLIIESEAEDELAESVAFYERKRAGLGLEFEEAVREAVGQVQKHPERYPLSEHGTRRFLMERFPFLIHYMELPDAIWIVAFAHTSREPGYWHERM